ncbi:acyltransferase [Microbacterium esteraromaticum]|uniref:Acyltransferase n=1 Tax=Microbacterium esteraromaticum TaxID=57043 RepID=A0A7D8AL80_9MICO|nr:acyltransferase [Microbacterium esteraromaticum]QMU98269.1 acyltransferase [Microbacterium esteraromaticum]
MSEHSEPPVTPAPLTRAAARRAGALRPGEPGDAAAAEPLAPVAGQTGRGADISRALERHDRRIGWMDLLRGLSILLVILHHSTQIVAYRIDDVPEFFTFLSAFFAPFRMPMLMFLSGLLVAGSLNAPAGKYVWGKVRRIVWPIIVWTFIYTASQLVADPGLKHMPWEPAFWDTYLWFMQFIFAYYIIALLLRWVPAWLMVAVPFAAMFLIPADLELLQRFFYLMPFFFLGAFIEKHWNRYAGLLSVPLAAGLAIIPLGVALYSGFIEPLWYEPLSALPAMLGILILVRLTAAAPEARWLAPVRFVGQYSLIYYVAHYPVFAALGWLAAKAGITSPGLGLVLIFAATVAISTGFALIGRRMPVSLLFELPRRIGRAKRA